MEKFLAPVPIGKAELSDQWERFKRDFLVALDKVKVSEHVQS